MSIYWITALGTSTACFLFKYLGHSVPESWLAHPRVQRINVLIPVALLSALVAVQAFTDKTKLVVDHRMAGVSFAVAAFVAKLPFPVAVFGAAIVSALVYRLS
jgi:Branched-chain amino acid transport protein (AzlD)